MQSADSLGPALLERAMEAAAAAAAAGAEAALAFFERGVAAERKPDASPVTPADRAAEAMILKTLRAAFADFGVLSEETGALGPQFPTRWIVDPLDGTRAFLRRGWSWGPLVALEHRGEIVAGAMHLPVLGRSYRAARGLGCHRGGARLRVSEQGRWPEATLSLGVLNRLLELPCAAGILDLARSADSTRAIGDGAGAAQVLEGAAEAWIEAGVKLWDLAAPMVLVEEAGGRFTDLHGVRTPGSGSAVASNGRVHAHILYTLGLAR
ncbi:MAG: inositol phosphatase [Planctomycetota bacterium]|nr:MAG: inositol phosphatase [Planctomycetota bacterium]